MEKAEDGKWDGIVYSMILFLTLFLHMALEAFHYYQLAKFL